MKVLDLFGCQTPVCAVGFECLAELVQDKVNGRDHNQSDFTAWMASCGVKVGLTFGGDARAVVCLKQRKK